MKQAIFQVFRTSFFFEIRKKNHLENWQNVKHFRNFPKITKKIEFPKKIENSDFISHRHFSIFLLKNPDFFGSILKIKYLGDFVMDVQKFWCSVKRRCPLLILIIYVFMKWASKCSIIEIYQNGIKKVALFDHIWSTSLFLVSCRCNCHQQY